LLANARAGLGHGPLSSQQIAGHATPHTTCVLSTNHNGPLYLVQKIPRTGDGAPEGRTPPRLLEIRSRMVACRGEFFQARSTMASWKRFRILFLLGLFAMTPCKRHRVT